MVVEANNLLDLLRLRVEQKPDRVAYRFLADGEQEASKVTYFQQDCSARGIAAVLMERRAPGERALLLYPAMLDFISAFLGCLYSGVTAVPLYPPRSDRSLPRLTAVASDAQPKLILTTSASLPTIQAWVSRMAGGRGIEVIATDQIRAEEASRWVRPDINSESVAFLQYTSGSTATSKGVMVTHGNLLHNEEMISKAFSQSESSRIVSWLPLYHDMGLIGGVLQPLYLGATCILMSPVAFVQNPLRWLQAITKYRATTSGGPNFAYDLCAARISQEAKEGLDLSSWSVAFNGSEPVREDTLRRFSQAFAACGFRNEAFYPCYGLAEATLFAAGGTAGSRPRIYTVSQQELGGNRAIASDEKNGKKLVGCGRAWSEQQVAIVDPEQRTLCAEGEIGEIWVSGPSVAQGYWNRPEETSKYFRVSLNPAVGGPDNRLFLRTGDLGFLHQEELFITGRIKDLIIVRGRNYYPQDLEFTAECADRSLRPGCSAAFSIESSGEERVVLVQEVEPAALLIELAGVIEKIRSAISQEYELTLHEVVLIKIGTVPKTSSGKIQRQACKAKYLRAELEVIARNTPAGHDAAERVETVEEVDREKLLLLEPAARRTFLERFIAVHAAKALRIPNTIATDQSLSSLGLDSLAAIELKHIVEKTFGVSLSLSQLIEGASTAELAASVSSGVEQFSAAQPRIFPSGPSPLEFPLSYGQRGLWFVQQLAPESSAYNIAAAAYAHGALSLEALQRAVQVLVDRHPALRTTFHSGIAGNPVQRVHEKMVVNIDFLATESWTEDSAMHQLCQKAWLAFNLEDGPLLRVAVLRRAQQEHLLLFAMHHICGDFWSFTIAFQELAELYLQECGSGVAKLPSLEVRYSDYVEWQNRELSGNRGVQLWEYWREALRPPLPDLDLPTDYARPPVQTYTAGTRSFFLDSALSERLLEISRAGGATLYMTLLAAFQILLHRYSGQKEILTGSPVAGRTIPEVAGLIGFFTNPLVMRLKIEGEPGFPEILQQIRQTVLNGLEHQEYPFPLLAERLRPVRDPSRSPLFQTMFILQKAQRTELEALTSLAMGSPGSEVPFGPITLRSLELAEMQAPFDLTLVMGREKTGLRASLQYNRNLFEGATAERILRQFAALLQGIAENPDQKVQSLPLLSRQDIRNLTEWNRTESSYPAEVLVHKLFEAQTDRKPQVVAVEDESRALTYAELNAKANQLARYLQKLGAGPESILAVCLDRSVELAIALLAVLKSGAAYLPLDPGFPETRLHFMLNDADVQVVLTKAALQSRLENRSRHLVLLDRDWAQIAQESPQKTSTATNPENLAYVIYTSGSTGLPKGVQITHRALLNFLASMKVSPGLHDTDVLLSVTTVSFDIFGLELYLPLISGAKVVLASRETAVDGYKLHDLLTKCRATVMQATPATWQMLLTASKRGLPPMRALCGGDILSPELVKELHARGCSVWNLYGPTETTIWSSVYEAAPAAATSMTGTAIGRPIANTQIYIFDSYQQPLPAGVPGELVIGGDGVARGYWGRPELTAEKFIPDPLSTKPGARLYRTGDLARLRTDGQIEFFGRLDNQVKVRGYRIELGEIESALSSYPGLQQAVVVARKQSSSDHRLVAYLVPQSGRAAVFEAGELRHFLSQRLPEAFVPSHFVTLDKLPLTLNGKVDRKALPDPQPQAPAEPEHASPKSEVERSLGEVWRRVLGREAVGVHDNFFDLGGHSLLLAQVQSSLRDAGYNVSMMDLFRHPTIAELARHISAEKPAVTAVDAGLEAARKRREYGQRKNRDIAVIGMAGRFPRAASVEEFWQRIARGEECISFFSDEELEKLGIPREVLQNANYVKAGGVLEGEDLFDAAFFGYNPREAELMDPQQRLFLDCAWHALDDAGYNSERYSARIGVFAGAGLNTYLHLAEPTLGQSSSERYQAFIGNDKDFTATRVSYKLNLKGPSVTVQTACSTSLVAVHLACQSLLNGECDMAMAGAIGVRLSQREGYLYESGGILSPDGHCRAFDKHGAGTVFGNGMGVVVLKPLHAAMEDGDNIYAVIKGSAINNDGSLKIGYTAPSVEGQAKVITEALSISGVEAETVGYIETHGTGTALGDPIEIEALADAFQAQTGKKGFCAIGSVKTNIGHLDTAAGIAGLIKTICALRYRQLPPSLNFSEPNSKIDFAASPFYVNTQLAEWPGNGNPRRAGVSSFGIGGTNAHVVLEEAPERDSSSPSIREWKLLTLSAKTLTALETERKELAAALKSNQESELSDISYTLQVGRRAFAYRCAVLCQEHSDAVAALEKGSGEQISSEFVQGEPPEIAFLFPGQGSQYPNMSRELYHREPVFRQDVDACAEILKPQFTLDIRQFLFPNESTEAADKELEQTSITQPALFVLEYALARLWMDWGIKPQAMLGHSIGEYVAACLAGVLSVEDALKLVAIRGKLMQSMPGGAMLGVKLPESELALLLPPGVSIAAVNSPVSCVVSGSMDAIGNLEETLATKEIPSARLHTSHAFHSSMMEPIVDDFVAAVGRASLHAPRIPYISNLTGDWIKPAQATDPRYWGQHMRHAVRFGDGIGQLRSGKNRILLECGPGHALIALARQQDRKIAGVSCLPHASEDKSDSFTMLSALAKLWLRGMQIDWDRFYARERRYRVPLPPYPFERQRYWIEADARTKQKEQALADWFFVPCWQHSALLPQNDVAVPAPILIFEDESGFAVRLAKRLRQSGNTVSVVKQGKAFATGKENSYVLDLGQKEHYHALFEDLAKSGALPRTIIHASNITTTGPGTVVSWREVRARSFDSLTFLAQALESNAPGEQVRIAVLSNGMRRIGREFPRQPEKAMLLGLLKVIPQEYPNISCKSIDVLLPEFDGALEDLCDDLLLELVHFEDNEVAYRGTERWTLNFSPLQLPARGGASPRLKDKGVYLITGGLGGLGLAFAETLAREARARLILTARSEFPRKAEWEQWAAKHGEQDERTQIIRKLQAIERTGGEILVVSADVADREAMQTALAQAENHFGAVQGVIHSAGVAGGGMIQIKTPELADQVLRPKVQGTLVLYSLLKDRPLDFFLLCSSINSVVGGFGQSDYSAANAFCDAFAQANFQARGCYTASINWDRWKEVGMAVKTVSTELVGLPTFLPPAKRGNGYHGLHPLLGAVVPVTDGKDVHIAEFSAEQQWVLSEHKIAEQPIVPGTTYLEMARAAFARYAQEQPVCIHQAVFPIPLIVQEGKSRSVLTILARSGEAFSFRVVSKAPESESRSAIWEEHARGEIAIANGSRNSRQKHDLAKLLQTFESDKIVLANGEPRASQQKFIITGPRWNVLKKVYVGERQSLAELELDERFAEDLAHYWLHPAVLDVATGFVHFLTEGDYLPLTYESITIWARLPKKILSYQKLRSDLKKLQDVITSDIHILDENGGEVVRIEGFSMKRVTADSVARWQKDAPSTEAAEIRLQRRFTGGMSPAQGAEVLQRILALARSPQIIVSTRDIKEVLAEAATLNRTQILSEIETLGSQEPKHARPELASAYAAPGNELEQRIVVVWQRVLGVDRVGIYDNFFELGGTSLNGVHLVAALKKELNVEVPAVSIFEAPTVAALARYLGADSSQAISARAQSRAERKKQALEMNAKVRAGAGRGR